MTKRGLIGVLSMALLPFVAVHHFAADRPSEPASRTSPGSKEKEPVARVLSPAPSPHRPRSAPPRMPAPAPAASVAFPPDDEARDRPPTVAAPVAEGRRWVMPDTPAGHALEGHLSAMTSVGVNAQAKYDASLAKLQEHSTEAAGILMDAYRNVPSGDYPARSALAQVLTELQSHAAVKPLTEIATSPIQAGLVDSDEDGRAAEEGTLRFTSVRGLGELAAMGNQDARDALETIARSDDKALRRYAAQLLAESDGNSRDARRYAGGLLPPEEQLAVEAREIPPEDQPSPTPRVNKPIDPARNDRPKEQRMPGEGEEGP